MIHQVSAPGTGRAARQALALGLAAALLATLAGCAAAPVRGSQVLVLLPTDAVLLGEQHDAPEHARIAREAVQALAERGQLAALAVEMAQQPGSTAHLPRTTTEPEVQAALRWNEGAWPWERYGPTVMAAVRAGVPVLGANLPGGDMRSAMTDASIDLRLSATALAAQRQAVDDGHCKLLPASQLGGMARIQIARDLAMAQTVARAARPGKAVLLLAGSAHVNRTLGVPLHLPPGLASKVLVMLTQPAQAATQSVATTDGLGADAIWTTPALPPKDYCAQLRAMFPPGRP